MKKLCTAMIVVALLGWASVSQAVIVGWHCADDGDGAVVCSANWNQSLYDLTVVGNQYSGPGHMLGSFTTDTELDPTVRVRNTIDNDTGFVWTGYLVNITMDKTFTLSDALVYTPGDWTTTVIQPVLTGSSYVGHVVYSAGTPIPTSGPDSYLDFGYKMSFLGTVHYCQEMTPVPEPATIAMLCTTGLGLLVYAWRRRRN